MARRKKTGCNNGVNVETNAYFEELEQLYFFRGDTRDTENVDWVYRTERWKFRKKIISRVKMFFVFEAIYHTALVSSIHFGMYQRKSCLMDVSSKPHYYLKRSVPLSFQFHILEYTCQCASWSIPLVVYVKTANCKRFFSSRSIISSTVRIIMKENRRRQFFPL